MMKSGSAQNVANNNRTALVIPTKTPSIAVIPSVSMEAEDHEMLMATHRKSIPSIPSAAMSSRQNVRRKSAEPIVHIYSNV